MSTTATFETLTESIGCRFMIANIFEANFNLDEFLFGVQYPVHILLPYEVRDVMGPHGVIRSVIPMEGFFLTKVENPTIDYKTGEIDIAAVEPMRAKGREFFDKLSLETIINSEVEEISIQWIPTYASFDAHIHGVNYRSEVPVIENIVCE